MEFRKSLRRRSANSASRGLSLRRELNDEVTLKGWLHRLEGSTIKQWKRRWCVLAEYALFVYKDQSEDKCVASILLPSYTIRACTTADRVTHKFAFIAEHQNMKTYYFAASSQTEMCHWKNAMALAANMQKHNVYQRARSATLPLGASCSSSTPPNPYSAAEGQRPVVPPYYRFGFDNADEFNQVVLTDYGYVGDTPRSRSLNSGEQPNMVAGEDSHFEGGLHPDHMGGFPPVYANAPPKPKRNGLSRAECSSLDESCMRDYSENNHASPRGGGGVSGEEEFFGVLPQQRLSVGTALDCVSASSMSSSSVAPPIGNYHQQQQHTRSNKAPPPPLPPDFATATATMAGPAYNRLARPQSRLRLPINANSTPKPQVIAVPANENLFSRHPNTPQRAQRPPCPPYPYGSGAKEFSHGPETRGRDSVHPPGVGPTSAPPPPPPASSSGGPLLRPSYDVRREDYHRAAKMFYHQPNTKTLLSGGQLPNNNNNGSGVVVVASNQGQYGGGGGDAASMDLSFQSSSHNSVFEPPDRPSNNNNNNDDATVGDAPEMYTGNLTPSRTYVRSSALDNYDMLKTEIEGVVQNSGRKGGNMTSYPGMAPPGGQQQQHPLSRYEQLRFQLRQQREAPPPNFVLQRIQVFEATAVDSKGAAPNSKQEGQQQQLEYNLDRERFNVGDYSINNDNNGTHGDDLPQYLPMAPVLIESDYVPIQHVNASSQRDKPTSHDSRSDRHNSGGSSIPDILHHRQRPEDTVNNTNISYNMTNSTKHSPVSVSPDMHSGRYHQHNKSSSSEDILPSLSSTCSSSTATVVEVRPASFAPDVVPLSYPRSSSSSNNNNNNDTFSSNSDLNKRGVTCSSPPYYYSDLDSSEHLNDLPLLRKRPLGDSRRYGGQHSLNSSYDGLSGTSYPERSGSMGSGYRSADLFQHVDNSRSDNNNNNSHQHHHHHSSSIDASKVPLHKASRSLDDLLSGAARVRSPHVGRRISPIDPNIARSAECLQQQQQQQSDNYEDDELSAPFYENIVRNSISGSDHSRHSYNRSDRGATPQQMPAKHTVYAGEDMGAFLAHGSANDGLRGTVVSAKNNVSSPLGNNNHGTHGGTPNHSNKSQDLYQPAPHYDSVVQRGYLVTNLDTMISINEATHPKRSVFLGNATDHPTGDDSNNQVYTPAYRDIRRDADDRMKRFYGIGGANNNNNSAPAECRSVRDVKRVSSENRQQRHCWSPEVGGTTTGNDVTASLPPALAPRLSISALHRAKSKLPQIQGPPPETLYQNTASLFGNNGSVGGGDSNGNVASAVGGDSNATTVNNYSDAGNNNNNRERCSLNFGEVKAVFRNGGLPSTNNNNRNNNNNFMASSNNGVKRELPSLGENPPMKPPRQLNVAASSSSSSGNTSLENSPNRRVTPKHHRRHHTLNAGATLDVKSACEKPKVALINLDELRRRSWAAPDVVQSTLPANSGDEDDDYWRTLDDALGRPAMIEIPRGTTVEDTSDEESALTVQERLKRTKKAAHIRRMLTQTINMDDVRKGTDSASEKKRLEHLLSLTHVVAKQVMEKSRRTNNATPTSGQTSASSPSSFF